MWPAAVEGMKFIEQSMGNVFGDEENPLLVSVRSGAAISMPGMMDTVLNLGINDKTVVALAKRFGERFAMDSYRRFLHMFGTVVMDMPHDAFESLFHDVKVKYSIDNDNDLEVKHLEEIVEQYKKIYVDFGKDFPSDPYDQLLAAILAVFNSWNSERAVKYRDAEGITGLLGTAVNVQAMVFGNMGPTSGTGVCFTRNPNTGEHKLYGEYLINAQGEDVVAGIRTPEPIEGLAKALPEAYEELINNIEILEHHYKDMLDLEFTIQDSKLYMLQTRSGKRTGSAAIQIALDLVDGNIATIDQAIKTVYSGHLSQLLHPQFESTEDDAYTNALAAKGLPASPGAAVGKIVFTAEEAEAAHARGEACILVRDETSPEDVGGMWSSKGVLTARGGMTSHAAVVARGWGKPCVCGCEALKFDAEKGTLTINGENGKTVTLHENDWISLNGDTGEVLVGELKLKPQSIDSSDNVARFMQWVDERRNIRILANADTPADALEARKNGAQGIGLTRTEHMFFSEDRINIVRKFILGRSEDVRRESLNQLLPFQRHDFEGILEAMDDLPVTVRLLDPPLHEFLPTEEILTETFAKDMGFSNLQECREAIDSLKESNPMLGLRGCRLGITNPALVEMQARALIEAALNNKYLKGLNPKLEIMIPLVSTPEEFKNQADLIRNTIEKVFEERVGQTIDYKLGTMIETPRAALVATDIANAGAEFFSYGTNDLTQMTYGFSRDDAGSFIPQYIHKNILETDPFETIDQAGVGALITSSANAGREVANNLAKTNPRMANFKAGVCGEHGGETRSVRFFVHNGLDYVSCSPFRVPIARLAAAQAVIEQESKDKDTKQKYEKKISRRKRKLFIKERNLVSTMYKVGDKSS